MSEQVEVVTKETESTVIDDPQHVKENDSQDFTSNKKTDEQSGWYNAISVLPRLRFCAILHIKFPNVPLSLDADGHSPKKFVSVY